MIVSRLCPQVLKIPRHMLYLLSEIVLYLLAALLVGFVMGWVLRGLQISRYTRSLQEELDKKNN